MSETDTGNNPGTVTDQVTGTNQDTVTGTNQDTVTGTGINNSSAESRHYHIEKLFIKSLETVINLSADELLIKLKSTYELSKKVKDHSHILYAFIYLYHTQLKKINSNIDYSKNVSTKLLMNLIYEHNTYAKLVKILYENPYI
jgi:hypothetical protein